MHARTHTHTHTHTQALRCWKRRKCLQFTDNVMEEISLTVFIPPIVVSAFSVCSQCRCFYMLLCGRLIVINILIYKLQYYRVGYLGHLRSFFMHCLMHWQLICDQVKEGALLAVWEFNSVTHFIWLWSQRKVVKLLLVKTTRKVIRDNVMTCIKA